MNGNTCISVFDTRVNEELDMRLVETVAEHNGGPDWRERVDFLKNFQKHNFYSMSRSTIDQIVQQEWIGAG